MGIEILAGVIASFLGALFPIIKDAIEKYYFKSLNENERELRINKLLAKFFEFETNQKTYKERLSETVKTLNNAFAEVEKATVEFTQLMQEKEKGIDFLEKKLNQLSAEESELKVKVETLQKIPIEAIPYFEEILNKGEKRSTYRDYILFVLGIVVSVIVTVVLKFYFNI